MPSRETAQALETMAALLPDTDPARRDLEADAYREWKSVDPKRAKALAKTWNSERTPHFKRLLSLFDPRDPDLARILMPTGSARVEYCQSWLRQLLDSWQEGDAAIAVHPLRACNNAGQYLPIAGTLVERMPELSREECDTLVIPLMRQICRHCTDPKDIDVLITLATCGGEKVAGPLFLEGVCGLVLGLGEYDVENWYRQFKRATRGMYGPWVRHVKTIALARLFVFQYRFGKPGKVSPRFVARWRRLDTGADWIKQLPSQKLIDQLLERRANLKRGTARHLREGAEAYLLKQRENRLTE